MMGPFLGAGVSTGLLALLGLGIDRALRLRLADAGPGCWPLRVLCALAALFLLALHPLLLLAAVGGAVLANLRGRSPGPEGMPVARDGRWMALVTVALLALIATRPLVPIATDEFLYDDGLNRFTVQRDDAGAVAGMRFFSNGEPPGTVVARTPEPLPAARQEVPLRRQELDRVTGTYAAGGMKLKVFMDGSSLKAQMGAQPAVEIFAESADSFFLTVVDATLAFAAGKDGAPTVTLSQGGNTTKFQRTP